MTDERYWVKKAQENYEAGKAEGRRLERRALMKLLNRPLALTSEVAISEIKQWVIQRAKPAKRKGR